MIGKLVSCPLLSTILFLIAAHEPFAVAADPYPTSPPKNGGYSCRFSASQVPATDLKLRADSEWTLKVVREADNKYRGIVLDESDREVLNLENVRWQFSNTPYQVLFVHSPMPNVMDFSLKIADYRKPEAPNSVSNGYFQLRRSDGSVWPVFPSFAAGCKEL